MDTALKAKNSGCCQIFSTKKDPYKGLRAFCQTIRNIGMVVAERSGLTEYRKWIHTTQFGRETKHPVHATCEEGRSMEMLKRASTAVLAILCSLWFVSPVMAESDVVVGGSPQARLDFRVVIQPILSLTLGSPGATIDRITFTVDQLPPTAITGVSSGTNPVPVAATGLVPAGDTITLTADSSAPLTDGTDSIPWTEVSWSGSGDFSSGAFTGGGAQQVDQFIGSGAYVGDYTFSYANSIPRPSATYDGQVTYTLSSP